MKTGISFLLLSVLGATAPLTLVSSTAWAQPNAPNCSIRGECTTTKELFEYLLNTYLTPTEGVYPIESVPIGTILATASTGNQSTTWTKENRGNITVETAVTKPDGRFDGRVVAFVEEHRQATVGQLIDWSRNMQLGGLQPDNPDEQCLPTNCVTSVTFSDGTTARSMTNHVVCGCFFVSPGTFTCPNVRITTLPNGGGACSGC